MSPPDRAALVDQREFLERSIDDLDSELAAGALDGEDHAALVARYAARLAAVDAALDELSVAEGPPAVAGTAVAGDAEPVRAAEMSNWRRRIGGRRARRRLGWGAAVCFSIAAALLVSAYAGLRLPGEGVSGSTTVSTAQQLQETLAQAAVLGSEGHVSEAVRLYDQVLATDPDQPVALAYGGWLVRLAGLARHDALVVAAGDGSIAKAVGVAPSYPDAHALEAVALFADRQDAGASVSQFRLALADHPTAALVASVAPFAAKAFAAAHDRLPHAFARTLEANRSNAKHAPAR